MEAAMSDGVTLVSLADVAEMAGVSRPAVSNWRRRNADFPKPVTETGATSLFRLADLTSWMAKHGKRLDVRSVGQLVWSALNPARGAVLPETGARTAMILLGYLELALRLDETVPPALRDAIAANNQSALHELLDRLDARAPEFGLSEVFPAEMAISQSPDSRSFLVKVLDLAIEHGVAETFEALVAASGRGSRGEGEHTTPSSIADLVMSLADPVSGVLIDPACGYGTFLLAASRAAMGQITLIGQDINSDTSRLARLRMFVHGQAADIVHGDTLRAGTLFDATAMDGAVADLVVADPPFGMNWHPEFADAHGRMPYGVPPPSRADLAWLQDGISRLGPDGLAMFIFGNGSVFRGGTEGEIRSRLIESRCIRAVVTLPAALYPTTNISVTLWIAGRPGRPGEVRPGEDSVLLVDASQLGQHRGNRTELSGTDVAAITSCFRAWQARGELDAEQGVRATTVPVGSLLTADGNLNPARWIKDPADDPQLWLERVTAAERDLRAAGAAFSGASFPLPPLAAGHADRSQDSWAIRKITDLATLIRPRRMDPDLIGKGTTPLIRVSDIGPDLAAIPGGRVDLEHAKGPVEITQPGDVVVVADGAKPRAAVDHRGGAVVAAPLQVARLRSDSLHPTVLAGLITSFGPRYAAGTSVMHLDLTALEVPCPDPDAARWLGEALVALGEQRRKAQAAVKAIDELRAGLVGGIGSRAIRLEPATHNGEGN
jgi:type I restriction-modification system DNA methylase subunit/predicted DNA-binding transcriptional regulator AlpA